MINPQDYYKKPEESIDQYNARIAALRTTDTNATQDANYKDLFSKAGSAGLGVGDLTKIITPSQDDTSQIQDTLAKQYGYTDFNSFVQDVFQKPSKTTEQFYNDAYAAAGLPTLIQKLTTKKDQLNTATGNINENPWLDEASRVGRSKRLQDLAQGDISNIQDEYNLKLNGVHDLVTQHAQDFADNQNLNQARLAYLLKQAETQAQQKSSETVQKYLPDYLKSIAPNTVKLPDGSLATWDSTQGKFVAVNPLADTSTATVDQIAETIKQLEGGDYNARGASGELGAYQFMPNTWTKWSQEYLQGTGQAPQSLAPTQDNQDAVAKFKIQQLLSQGNTPEQIASIWNSGSPNPAGKVGTNSKGVKYNTPAYVERFKSVLSKTLGSANSDVNALAQQLVNGTLAPSQLSKRTNSYNAVLNAANALSLAQTGQPFDAMTAEQQFQFGKSEKTQLIVSSARIALQTIDRAVASSNNVDRGQLSFVNNLVIGTKKATSDPKTAVFITDINSLGDEIGTVLGQGSATDFKTQLGLLIADKSLSKEAFAAAMNELAHLFKNKINTTLDQAGKGTLPNSTSAGDIESIKSQYGISY